MIYDFFRVVIQRSLATKDLVCMAQLIPLMKGARGM